MPDSSLPPTSNQRKADEQGPPCATGEPRESKEDAREPLDRSDVTEFVDGLADHVRNLGATHEIVIHSSCETARHASYQLDAALDDLRDRLEVMSAVVSAGEPLPLFYDFSAGEVVRRLYKELEAARASAS